MTTITPAGFPFSMFDPIHLGMDENGEHVFVNLAERNMLLGGEPGAGKSSGINLIVAHGALSCDCKLILVDGKRVELGPWRDCADMFIGPSIKDATQAFEAFQKTMDEGYDKPLADGRRKITRDSGEPVYLIVIDEYAYFSATVGTKTEREKFAALTRDLVARGRAAGVIVILATQRPSHQVIDPSMRDLFGYRWAFRCTTDSSSDTVLGHEPPVSSSSWPRSGHRIRSSTLPCGTCSATGGRFAAPPTHPRTPCSGTAGPGKASPRPPSTRWPGVSAGCYPRPASRAGSSPPTSPTRTLLTSPTSLLNCGTEPRPHEPRTRPHPLQRPHT